MASYRQLLGVIIYCGGGNKLKKSGGREVFVGGRGRRNDICISVSAVVGEENWRRRGIRKRSTTTWYYYFLCPSGSWGGWHNPEVSEAKREVGTTSEEVK